MIIIDKLKKNFGEKIAVDIEHYEINQGDMLGLVGNNGAGKTTLFRIMLEELHGSLYRRRFPDRLPHPRRILLLHR